MDIEVPAGKLGVKLSLICPGNLEKEISSMLQGVAEKVHVETLISNVVSATCFVELGKSLKKVKGFNQRKQRREAVSQEEDFHLAWELARGKRNNLKHSQSKALSLYRAE